MDHTRLLISRKLFRDGDADVGVLLIGGGRQAQVEAVILGNVGDAGSKSGLHQAILRQSGAILHGVSQSTEIGDVSQELRSESGDAVTIDTLNRFVQQDRGRTHGIGDVDEIHTIQGVAGHHQLGTTVVVHQQLVYQIQNHHVSGGGVQSQVIGAQIDLQLVPILLQLIDAVVHNVIHEVIAVLQIGGHVGSILTGGNVEVTDHLSGDRTAFLGIQSAIHDG